MTNQCSRIYQSTVFKVLSARRLASTLQFQAGLTALLLVCSGATILSTEANASSSKVNEVIAPTLTAQVPANVTVYVNLTTGSDSDGAGNAEAAPYKTITYALNQAQPGTVIQLAPGNYTKETGKSSHLLSSKVLRCAVMRPLKVRIR